VTSSAYDISVVMQPMKRMRWNFYKCEIGTIITRILLMTQDVVDEF